MMESYFGLSAKRWYDEFSKKGMDIFSENSVPDSDILIILGRCCVGREIITPVLIKNNWTLDRFIEAEKKLGVDTESLQMMVGEYLEYSNIDHRRMNPREMRALIDSNFDLRTLMSKGATALQNYKH